MAGDRRLLADGGGTKNGVCNYLCFMVRTKRERIVERHTDKQGGGREYY